jgi:hypothetical protein
MGGRRAETMRVDLVACDDEQPRRDLLDQAILLLTDLIQDPTPWEWWVDEWARNGWTIRTGDTHVVLDKQDEHHADTRLWSIDVPDDPRTHVGARTILEHMLDVMKTVHDHADAPDGRARLADWILAITATAHPCGTLPETIGLASPFTGASSLIPGMTESGSPPPGSASTMLAHAPTALSWNAGFWNDVPHLSITDVIRHCGPEMEIDPDRDPLATMRALARVKAEIGEKTKGGDGPA